LALDTGTWGNDLRMGAILVLALEGDHAKAAAQAKERLEQAPESERTHDWAGYVLCAASETAAKDAKLPKAQRDQLAEAYASQAVAHFAKAHALGHYKTPISVAILKKDPLLATLRGRADFKKLLGELDK
jgi:hypothetical protein